MGVNKKFQFVNTALVRRVIVRYKYIRTWNHKFFNITIRSNF